MKCKSLLLLIALQCSIPSVFGIEQGANSPTCNLDTFDSATPMNIKQFAGQVVLVDFWASWCPPCAKSFPFLNSLHQDFQNQGLKVIGVNLDEDKSDSIQFLKRYPAQFQLATDPSSQCAEDFKLKAMPTSYLIDRQGIVRHVHLGFRQSDQEQLQDLIQQLLLEKNINEQ